MERVTHCVTCVTTPRNGARQQVRHESLHRVMQRMVHHVMERVTPVTVPRHGALFDAKGGITPGSDAARS